MPLPRRPPPQPLVQRGAQHLQVLRLRSVGRNYRLGYAASRQRLQGGMPMAGRRAQHHSPRIQAASRHAATAVRCCPIQPPLQQPQPWQGGTAVPLRAAYARPSGGALVQAQLVARQAGHKLATDTLLQRRRNAHRHTEPQPRLRQHPRGHTALHVSTRLALPTSSSLPKAAPTAGLCSRQDTRQ